MTNPDARPFTKEDLLSVEQETFRRFRDKVTRFVKMPNHSVRRLSNRVVNYADRKLRAKPKVGAMPYAILVEPTTACQLKCPLCPVGNGMLERPPVFLEMELYKKVVDELAPYLYTMNFNGSGEPLLHPKIVEMIEHGAAKGLWMDVFTNFQLLRNDIIDALPGSGLNRILISLDGTDKETYESYRIRGSFERIVQNIRRLVEKRDATPKSRLVIDIQFVAMKQNEHQIEDIQRLVKELGADSLIIKRTFLFQGTGDTQKTLSYLPESEALSLYKKDQLRPDDAKNPIEWKGAEHKICELLWTSSVLLADGRVSPCCFDYHGWVILGDANQRTMHEIWNGPEYQAFRALVSADWRKVKLCTSMLGGCPTMRLEPSDWYVRNE
jgi:MoaA/NifB/PqqE/SkfB family radical SAM enzyme